MLSLSLAVFTNLFDCRDLLTLHFGAGGYPSTWTRVHNTAMKLLTPGTHHSTTDRDFYKAGICIGILEMWLTGEISIPQLNLTTNQ